MYNSSKIIINNTSDTTHPVEIIRVLPILLMLLVDCTALPVLFLCSWVVVSGMNITYIYLLNNIKPIFTFFERLKNGVKYNVWLWKKSSFSKTMLWGEKVSQSWKFVQFYIWRCLNQYITSIILSLYFSLEIHHLRQYFAIH